MLKPILSLAATGVVALVLWKLLVLLLLPFLGIAIGLLVTVVKFVFIAALVMFAIWLVRRLNRRETSPA